MVRMCLRPRRINACHASHLRDGHLLISCRF